ncbi:MAG: hypothetical protein AAF791_03665 [Bacteroidota bacterium]
MEPDHEDLSPPLVPDPSREGRGLMRLRDRVAAAAAEIERLREENAALAERVAHLSGGDAGIELSGDPAQLRTTIQGFIDAIDRVLDGDATPS